MLQRHDPNLPIESNRAAASGGAGAFACLARLRALQLLTERS
jgi:hypothetical protein